MSTRTPAFSEALLRAKKAFNAQAMRSLPTKTSGEPPTKGKGKRG